MTLSQPCITIDCEYKRYKKGKPFSPRIRKAIILKYAIVTVNVLHLAVYSI